MKIKGMSLFSGGGIGEMRLNETNVDIIIANELLPKRCEFYSFYNPKTDVVNADIIIVDYESGSSEAIVSKGYDKFQLKYKDNDETITSEYLGAGKAIDAVKSNTDRKSIV